MEIGWRCKCSNVLSWPILINRGLNHEKKEVVKKRKGKEGIPREVIYLCIFECAKAKAVKIKEVNAKALPILSVTSEALTTTIFWW